MNYYKYIWLVAILIGFTSCEEEDNFLRSDPAPELTKGSVDFSNYVAVGASFTAGFTDNALFAAGQEYSFSNILAQQFAKIGGGSFTQPLMGDNIGGLLLGGMPNARFGPRLYFYSDQNPDDDFDSGPYPLGVVPHELDFTPEVPTTEATINLNNSFNNMGIPGAKSFHLLFDGYGNPANLASATANPYFVRIASSPTATVLEDAMAQNPTFFTLSEIGAGDVLGYALTGGDGSDPITSEAIFNASFNALVGTLTSAGAKGVVANAPYITDLPHFTTVPHNPVPLDGATAAFLNSALVYGAYNAGIIDAFAFLVATNQMSQDDADKEIAKRTIIFSESSTNAVVIMDESLTDLTGLNDKLISMRQATEDDLLVLTASTFIGTEAVPGNSQTVNGVAIPLADKWVLTPEEQKEIKDAIDAFNVIIATAADASENIALVDLNSILAEVASTGVEFDNFTLKSDLVSGGAFGLDGIHPTGRGYAFMANKFLEAIDANFDTNFVASGNIAKASQYPTNYSGALR